jgi:hypothetical protein
MTFKRKSKKNKRNKCKVTRKKITKSKVTRRKYSNKKKNTRNQKGGVDPPFKKKSIRSIEEESEVVDRINQEQQQTRDILTIINKYHTRSLINDFRKIGYEIELNENNEWEILKYPVMSYLNTKLPYILHKLSSYDRSIINTALIDNDLTNLSPEIMQIILTIVTSNNSGCDLERDEVVEQAIRNRTINKHQVNLYRGKVGTIVIPGDEYKIDPTDGPKNLENVRLIVPSILPNKSLLSLAPGLYKLIKKTSREEEEIKIIPSKFINFSLIKFKILTLLYPGQPIFVANMDKVLPKVRLLASFGQRGIYDEWFQFLQRLGAQGITKDNITEEIITANNFQSSPKEIVDWIQSQQVNLSDYISYPGWNQTILSISEVSHPCLNEGITDVYYAAEFCVICYAERNCYITKVRPYSGHYKPSNLMLQTMLRNFIRKGYSDLKNYRQICLATSLDEDKDSENCPSFDLTNEVRQFIAPIPI